MATVYVLQGPDKGRTWQINGERSMLGRRAGQIELTDHTVSRRHAEFQHAEDAWRVSDLGSSNGTYVNGERIGVPTSLKHNDQIKVGGTLLVFRARTPTDGYHEVRDDEPFTLSEASADSSILAALPAAEDSLILAAPETAEAVQAWNMMYLIAEAAGGLRTVKELLESVTDAILKNLFVDHVAVLMRQEGATSNKVEPVIVRYRSKTRRRNPQIAASSKIIQHVIETKSGVLCADTAIDPRFNDDGAPASAEKMAARSVICVPITGHAEVHGVIHMDCAATRHTYSHETLRLATAVGRVLGMAIENHKLMEARMRAERLAAVGETVAYLSHHIRNILQGLRSGADLVEMGLKKGQQEMISGGWQTVDNNLNRILHLTTNMLTFSKDREPKIGMTQINTQVEDALALAQRPADEHHVALSRTCDDLPPVPTDADGVHQAVLNLILNAISACPASGGEVHVRTRFDAARHYVAVSVRDNGQGIPKERLKHIFLPFYSSKGHGGTGLGLAATKKIVDELQGELIVESAPGKGTCFEIRLPSERSYTRGLDQTFGPAK